MADIRSTNDVSIRDETSSNHLVIDSEGEANVKTKVWDGTNEVSVSDNALDVNALPNPRPGKGFAVFLKNGGSNDLVVDGSSTPVTFSAAPGTGKKWYIHSISILFEDTGINFNKFGGITALTNGVDLKITEGGESERLGLNAKKNSDFYEFATAVILQSAATDVLSIRSNIKISQGTTFELKDSLSENVKVVVNDNLTGIDRFNVLVKGYEVSE